MKRTLSLWAAPTAAYFAVATLASSGSASEILFDSLSLPTSSSMLANWVAQDFYPAQGFRTGDSDSFLDSVSLDLRSDGTTGAFQVELWDATHLAWNPSQSHWSPVSLGFLDGPLNPGTGVAVFTPASPLTLQANTLYRVTAQYYTVNGPADAHYTWLYGDGYPAVGTAVAPSRYYLNYDQWVGPGSADQPLRMEVDVTLVPEPSTGALLALGVVVGLALRCPRAPGLRPPGPPLIHGFTKRV